MVLGTRVVGMRSLLMAAAAISVLVASALPAAASILVNGDFEQPGGAANLDPLSPNYLPGWTHAGSGADYYVTTLGGLAAADGTHYVMFGASDTSGGSLSQTFATTVGTIYTLDYSVAEMFADAPAQNMRATIDNNGTTLSVDNSHLNLGAFVHGAGLSFTATGSSATVTFLDTTPPAGGSGSNLALDRVSVTAREAVAGVPEPATWAMILVGFGGLGAVLRRRRGQVAHAA